VKPGRELEHYPHHDSEPYISHDKCSVINTEFAGTPCILKVHICFMLILKQTVCHIYVSFLHNSVNKNNNRCHFASCLKAENPQLLSKLWFFDLPLLPSNF